MPLNPVVLRASFATTVERQPAITRRFYEILFERYPQVKPLFGGNSVQAQEEMLQQALVGVLDHLDDATWLQSTLSGLGAKHVAYGVTREMFDWVGAALLATLAEILQTDWSEEVEESWQLAYGAIRDLMLEGMAAEKASAASLSGIAAD
jgi:hemoglobin-like flavoprotein